MASPPQRAGPAPTALISAAASLPTPAAPPPTTESDLRLAAVAEVARALSAPWSLDQVLDLTMDRLTWALGADRSTLFLVDGDELVAKLAQGDTAREIRVRFGQGLAGWVAATGRPVNVKNAYDDSRFDPSWDAENGYRTQSMLCQPVYDRHDNLIAIAQVLNKKEGWFSVDDERMLATMIALAAISIVNARLANELAGNYAALQRARTDVADRARELNSLYELERETVRAANFDVAVAAVIDRMMVTVEADCVEVVLPTDAGGWVVHRARASGEAEVAPLVQLGLHGAALRDRATADLASCPAPARADLALASALSWPPVAGVSVPLLRDDELVGALGVWWCAHAEEDTHYDRVRFLELAGLQIGHALGHRIARTQSEREERMAAIGGALAGVVHDLKTPMTIASGYAQLLKIEADPVERGRLADGIVDQLRRMNDMTREVLGFARGDVQILPRKTLLPEWTRECEAMLGAVFDRTGVAWQVHCDDRGAVRFDGARILRAVQNLARNSRDAFAAVDGSAELARRFDLRVRTDGADLVIEAADNGPGVPRAFEHRLYEAFASHGKPDGTGLGLTMVKQVAEAHGGSIVHRPTPGGGATFEVRIPRDRPAAQDTTR